MTSELIVDVQKEDISIALLEDKRLVEFQQEGRSEQYAVGNIYLAKVRKIMPGLNACFVNVGYERDAFLHYLDLGVRYRQYEHYLSLITDGKRKPLPLHKLTRQPNTEKEGQIQTLVQPGQEVLVQVVKEPISTKGPRLTCEISFAGRYLVLIPFTDKVNVSTKIKSDAERARLKQLVHSLKPKGFGVIIRTVAEGRRAPEIDQELKILFARWEAMVEKIQNRNLSDKATLVYEETSRTVGLLRDLFNPSFESIVVNDPAVYEEVKDYVSLIAPERKSIVKHYQGKVPIFDNYNITRQIKTSLGRTVTYKRGAYMIIEHTEAMHVVDINSGNRSKSEEGQEVNALDVNLGAADELARQLRLRDMGGIIVVDFIDMAQPESRQQLYERMVENMKQDRARHNILPISKFGLMQITRQRVRPAMAINLEESCPSCSGSGKIKSSFLFTDALESKIRILVEELKIRRFRLHVHPYVAAYINKGFLSLRRRWQFHYSWRLSIVPDQSLAFLEYKFIDHKGEEIDMQEERENQ
ncbi:MAG: Rne/Rng family ribonuclease [Bacteroidales bacterium]|nr:Rne/Rng family ribonuclease [Bacteroidales bacterium]